MNQKHLQFWKSNKWIFRYGLNAVKAETEDSIFEKCRSPILKVQCNCKLNSGRKYWIFWNVNSPKCDIPQVRFLGYFWFIFLGNVCNGISLPWSPALWLPTVDPVSVEGVLFSPLLLQSQIRVHINSNNELFFSFGLLNIIVEVFCLTSAEK